MKIIEAMKRIKDNQRKLDDIIQKVKIHCADMDYETAVYPDQKGQISSWIQMYEDIVREIEKLQFSLQKTNVETMVTINLEGNDITKSVSQSRSQRIVASSRRASCGL